MGLVSKFYLSICVLRGGWPLKGAVDVGKGESAMKASFTNRAKPSEPRPGGDNQIRLAALERSAGARRSSPRGSATNTALCMGAGVLLMLACSGEVSSESEENSNAAETDEAPQRHSNPASEQSSTPTASAESTPDLVSSGTGDGETNLNGLVDDSDDSVDGGGVTSDVEEPPRIESPVPLEPGLSGGYRDTTDYSGTAGYAMFAETVQPLLAERCGDCHLGDRFAFASLARSGTAFTDADTRANYATWTNLLSLDSPEHSRLLAKILPEGHERAIEHRAGPQVTGEDDELYTKLLAWAEQEKATQCPQCGTSAPAAYIAYVKQPDIFWMLEREPTRTDRGERSGARIMLQPVDPETSEPIGDAVDFLAGAANNFCADDDCDFGHLASNHSGTQLVFECRVSVNGEPWLERGWNMCIAEIGQDGRAENPRFLLQREALHSGVQITRTDPFGIDPDIKGTYDKHHIHRWRNDVTPAFSADDRAVLFASARPDPRTGVDAVQTYHGTFFLANLISVPLDGGTTETIYRNEGGTVDSPFWLRNGNIAFHTWNLERGDRHMYLQAQADGMMELPVLGGALQGPSAWGKAFESNNGVIVGLTGRRRGELTNYAPFVFDHTMGISTTDNSFTGYAGFQYPLEGYLEEIGDYPNGFCPSGMSPEERANTKNCHISKLIQDPSYLPDNRALIAYNPEKTYIGEGERFALAYMRGGSISESQASVKPYLPKRLGVGVMDQRGNLATLIPNEPGFMYRYPVWVGPRQHPRIQQFADQTEETESSELHIADVPLWFAFGKGTKGGGRISLQTLDDIRAVRVLRKVAEGNACVMDSNYIRMSNMRSGGYHPTALGIIDATGFEQYFVPQEIGGNGYGDVPVNTDGSVRLRIPAGELLLFQGVSEAGTVLAQHPRVFALPPGRRIDTSVKREQYFPQCAECHGVLNGGQTMDAARDVANLPALMDFETEAATQDPVDVTHTTVERRVLSYLAQLRPVLDAKCVSCHSAEEPGGSLSLQAEYSATGNYPPQELEPYADQDYLAFMEGRKTVRSYNYSVSYAWLFDKDHSEYKRAYQDEIESDAPLGALAPWDSGYQNLFRLNEKRWYYLNSVSLETSFGRGLASPSASAYSFLIEVLSGRDLDPNSDYTGAYDHTGLLDEAELRTWMAVIDVGMPYMSRCDEKIIPEGPHAGQPWGDPQ